jgi:hypothetical protein
MRPTRERRVVQTLIMYIDINQSRPARVYIILCVWLCDGLSRGLSIDHRVGGDGYGGVR